MYFANDQFGKRVSIEQTHVKQDYFCPICSELLVLKKGEIRVHHFAHKANSQCTDTWHYDMSEWHFEWQNRFPEDCQEIVMAHEGKKHRADVVIGKTVVEFQYSSLSMEEFEERNAFYQALGYKVVWIFDMTEPWESGALSCLENSDFKMRWSRPKPTFNCFDPKKEKNVRLYFQTDYTDSPDEFAIGEISWVAPSGFERFVVKEWISIPEFIGLFIKTPRKIQKRSPDDIVDNLVKIRNVDNEFYFYGCTKPVEENKMTPLADFDLCIDCPFHKESIDGSSETIGCSRRFKDCDFSDVENLKSIFRSLDGFVTKIEYVGKDGANKTRSFPTFPTIARTLDELWKQYNPNQMICLNLRTGTQVQVFNPGWQMRTQGFVEGKFQKFNGEMSTKKVKLFDVEKREWVMRWFAKNKNF